MPVTLELTYTPSPAGDLGPLWRVQCEDGGEYDRLFLLADDPDPAARRAEAEHAWVHRDGKVWCPFHGRVGHG